MRHFNLVIANAMAVIFLGLVAGIFLLFSLLEAVTLWPLPVWEVQVPGTTRGWQAAHVGGILNGVMVSVIALVVLKIEMEENWQRWSAWGLIITGWGNTVFYWAGNLAANRGLSMVDTPFGAADIWGALAFLGGGIAMFFTFAVIIMVGLSAYRGMT